MEWKVCRSICSVASSESGDEPSYSMRVAFAILILGLRVTVTSAKLSPIHHVLMRQGRRLQVPPTDGVLYPARLWLRADHRLCHVFRWRTERWYGLSLVRQRRVSGESQARSRWW